MFSNTGVPRAIKKKTKFHTKKKFGETVGYEVQRRNTRNTARDGRKGQRQNMSKSKRII
jgi:hypothetical protein